MLSFAQKGVLLALDEAERRVKACAAAQDTGLAVARAEVIERDIELPLARAVLRILEQVELVRRAVFCLERRDAYHCLLLVGELERAVAIGRASCREGV